MELNYINLPPMYWENEYQHNYGTYLENEKEIIRYLYTSKIITRQPVYRYLLDLGCGTGIMEKYLPSVVSVTGVDIAENAIEFAIKSRRGQYFHANVETYIPQKKFDIVLFNESLYYFSNARAVVERYKNFLNNDGRIVLSIYYPHVGHKYYHIFKNLINDIKNWNYTVTDHEIAECENLRWKIMCLCPKEEKGGYL